MSAEIITLPVVRIERWEDDDVAPIQMTKDEMRNGFASGRTLTQEEWAHPDEIKWLDELIADGVAVVSAPWEYKDGFQCARRRVTGIRNGQSENGK